MKNQDIQSIEIISSEIKGRESVIQLYKIFIKKN